MIGWPAKFQIAFAVFVACTLGRCVREHLFSTNFPSQQIASHVSGVQISLANIFGLCDRAHKFAHYSYLPINIMVDFHLPAGSITDHDDTKGFGRASVPTTAPCHDMPTCQGVHSTHVHPRSAGDVSLTESCSGKSSHDEECDEYSFDMHDSMRMSGTRPTLVTMPIVVEVVPRRGFYHSEDPLFQGVCLYNGCMTDSQREEMECKLSIDNAKEAHTRAPSSGRLSSIFSSIFSGHA